MGKYRVAQVCPNEHLATTTADQNRELWEAICSQCSEATTCSAPIRGDYHVEAIFGSGGDYEPPSFCHNCGSQFPWTERKIACAVELVEAGADLSPE